MKNGKLDMNEAYEDALAFRKAAEEYVPISTHRQTNYEKYFGTPEKAAESIDEFRMAIPWTKSGAMKSFHDWLAIHLFDVDDDASLMLAWLESEAK